jgi:hypothetical protein
MPCIDKSKKESDLRFLASIHQKRANWPAFLIGTAAIWATKLCARKGGMSVVYARRISSFEEPSFAMQ